MGFRGLELSSSSCETARDYARNHVIQRGSHVISVLAHVGLHGIRWIMGRGERIENRVPGEGGRVGKDWLF